MLQNHIRCSNTGSIGARAIMIDLITRKRVPCLILLLIISVAYIVFIDQYEKFWLLDSKRIFKGSGVKVSKKEPIEGNSSLKECRYSNLAEECQQCSDFMVTALQSEYCLKTGFYEVYTCHDESNQTRTSYQSCPSPFVQRTRNLVVFGASSLLTASFSSLFIKWRKNVIEKRSYARLPTTC